MALFWQCELQREQSGWSFGTRGARAAIRAPARLAPAMSDLACAIRR